jgi:hypothetical protein
MLNGCSMFVFFFLIKNYMSFTIEKMVLLHF